MVRSDLKLSVRCAWSNESEIERAAALALNSDLKTDLEDLVDSPFGVTSRPIAIAGLVSTSRDVSVLIRSKIPTASTVGIGAGFMLNLEVNARVRSDMIGVGDGASFKRTWMLATSDSWNPPREDRAGGEVR